MSKPTAAVTYRYHKKKYDIMTATVPKGYAAKIKEAAANLGTSVNSYMTEKLTQIIEEDEKERAKEAESQG